MENLYSIETVYIDKEGIPHTKVYTEAQYKKAKADFEAVRKYDEHLPIRCCGRINKKLFNVVKGDKYAFDELILTVDGESEWGGKVTYLLRKHNIEVNGQIRPVSGLITVNMNTRKGPKPCGVNFTKHQHRTEEQMMNIRNEGNFDRFYFLDEVIG